MKPPINQDSVINLKRVLPTITVANNGITPILNTTLDDNAALSSTVVGQLRGKYSNLWLVVPYLKVTTQPVTLTFQTLFTGAWGSSIDVPSGYVGGGNTIAASANPQQGFSLRIYGDVNVFITNGATGPGVLELGIPYLTNIDPRGNP